jgi:protein SCO1
MTSRPPAPQPEASARATALACLVVLAAFGAAVSMLTGGLEHWTFESLRKAQAASGQRVAPATVLRNSRGEHHAAWGVRNEDKRPVIHIVDFIYTTCPTVCQALGSEYQQMQRLLRDAPDSGVRLLSISFDGARDGADELAAYARRYGADAAVWSVTAPADAAEQRALLRALGVVAVPDGLGGYVHNASLHLIDARGQLHAIYDYSEWARALAHARGIAQEATP